MTIYYVDASAWVKRYTKEPGSDWVGRFWATGAVTACATLGLIEVLSAVARQCSHAKLGPEAIRQALQGVESDFAEFEAIPLDESVLTIARRLPAKWALRGADTIHLASVLRLRQASSDPIALIASDDELLRAAAAEGVSAIDPRTEPR